MWDRIAFSWHGSLLTVLSGVGSDCNMVGKWGVKVANIGLGGNEVWIRVRNKVEILKVFL